MEVKNNIFKTNHKRFIYVNKYGYTYSIWAYDEDDAYEKLKKIEPTKWQDYILEETRESFIPVSQIFLKGGMDMKYRKKPVVIEAVQFTDDELSIPTIEDFMQAVVVGNKNGTGRIQEIIISTLEGQMTAMKGDWIIKGINKPMRKLND